MTEDALNSAKRESSSKTPLLIWIFVILGYPLSSGPAIVCFERFSLGDTLAGDVMMSFYWPMIWLARWDSPHGIVGRWLYAWEAFWMGLAH